MSHGDKVVYQKEVKFTNMATGGSDSDEIKNIRCCLCAEDNRTRAAEKYCIQCKDYFCSSCIIVHKKFPLMKDHSVLDKADLSTVGLDGSLPSYPTQRCGLHKLEVVTMYCKDHDEVACAPCIALNHKSCKNTLLISEQIGQLYPQTALVSVKVKISTLMQNMEEIKTSQEVKGRKLHEALEKEIESVKAFRQELQTLLETMEQETIKELKLEFSKIEASLAAETNTVESLVTSLNEAASQLRDSEGNRAQEFVCIKSSENITTKAAEEVQRNHQQTTKEIICFKPDQNIKSSLQTTKTLGKISTNKINNQLSTEKINNQIYAAKDGLYKVKTQKEINIKLADDNTDCKIMRSCITDDSILLSDYFNKKLKFMDLSTEKVRDFIDLPASPHAVCTVSEKEAAVTLNNQSVQFVTFRDKMAATRSLKMDHCCWGLAHNDGQLFITDLYNTLYIYNMIGQVLKKISADTSGQSVFKATRHIVSNSASNRVFVADMGTGLVALDIQAKYLSTLSDTKVSSCFGICTDGRNVFVCGAYSQSIVQIGKDLSILGELGKVNKPRSLCFDQSKKKLIVTSDENKITIIELD